MTVREWITRRAPQAPQTLIARILAALGPDADADVSGAAEVCLAAATRALDGLLSESRFSRESALDLLTVDALTTFAFEHASQSGGNVEELEALAARGTHLLGQLMSQRV